MKSVSEVFLIRPKGVKFFEANPLNFDFCQSVFYLSKLWLTDALSNGSVDFALKERRGAKRHVINNRIPQQPPRRDTVRLALQNQFHHHAGINAKFAHRRLARSSRIFRISSAESNLPSMLSAIASSSLSIAQWTFGTSIGL